MLSLEAKLFVLANALDFEFEEPDAGEGKPFILEEE